MRSLRVFGRYPIGQKKALASRTISSHDEDVTKMGATPMSGCIVNFNHIEIVNQMSDTRHRDNDWMTVAWTVNGLDARTEKFRLTKPDGDFVLKSGDVIAPFSLRIDCGNLDIVQVTYSIINLGSTDLSDQVKVAGDFAKKIAQTIAEIYLTVAAEVLPHAAKLVPGLPFLGQAIAEAGAYVADKFKGRIVSLVGDAFDSIITPVFVELTKFVQIVLGKPICDGVVLLDSFIFMPNEFFESDSRFLKCVTFRPYARE